MKCTNKILGNLGAIHNPGMVRGQSIILGKFRRNPVKNCSCAALFIGARSPVHVQCSPRYVGNPFG